MSGKKRKTYSLNFKLDAVKFAEANSLSKAADHFRVHISQIKRWKSQKELIQAKPNKNGNVAKRIRGQKWPQLENYLLHWIKAQHKESTQVSGTSILKEARDQASKMFLNDFKGSPNWIFKVGLVKLFMLKFIYFLSLKFMKRNGIARREMSSTNDKSKKITTFDFEEPDGDSDDEEVRKKLVSFLMENKF